MMMWKYNHQSSAKSPYALWTCYSGSIVHHLDWFRLGSGRLGYPAKGNILNQRSGVHADVGPNEQLSFLILQLENSNSTYHWQSWGGALSRIRNYALRYGWDQRDCYAGLCRSGSSSLTHRKCNRSFDSRTFITARANHIGRGTRSSSSRRGL